MRKREATLPLEEPEPAQEADDREMDRRMGCVQNLRIHLARTKPDLQIVFDALAIMLRKVKEGDKEIPRWTRFPHPVKPGHPMVEYGEDEFRLWLFGDTTDKKRYSIEWPERFLSALQVAIKDDPALRANFYQWCGGDLGPNGTNQFTGARGFNIIKPSSGVGTTASYAIRRLARDRPDLLEKVKTGELTPHAAAVVAGFRKKQMQCDEAPLAWARAGLRRWDAATILAALAAVSGEDDATGTAEFHAGAEAEMLVEPAVEV